MRIRKRKHTITRDLPEAASPNSMEEVATHIRAGIVLHRAPETNTRLARHSKQTEKVMKQPDFFSKRARADRVSDPTEQPHKRGKSGDKNRIVLLAPKRTTETPKHDLTHFLC